MKLNSGTTYALSAWIKTEGVNGGHGALLNVHELQHKGKTNAVKGNGDWKKVELVFEHQSGPLTINCLFGGWGKPRAPRGTTISPCRKSNRSTRKPTDRKSRDWPTAGGDLPQTAVASCVRCHKIGNEGGVIGPALDGIASRGSGPTRTSSTRPPPGEGFDKLGANPIPNEPAAKRPAARRRHGLPHDVEEKIEFNPSTTQPGRRAGLAPAFFFISTARCPGRFAWDKQS